MADTFLIATVKLQGLGDPGQLGSWLHAVARNECLRQAGALDRPVPAVPALSCHRSWRLDDVERCWPAGLREQVLAACGDNTPTGRANRVSVAHRAGPFGRTGFPKPVCRGRAAVVARGPAASPGGGRVAAVAAAVVAAGIVALLMTGEHAPGPAPRSVALGGGGFGTSSATSGAAGGRSSPNARPASASASARRRRPSSDRPTGARPVRRRHVPARLAVRSIAASRDRHPLPRRRSSLLLAAAARHAASDAESSSSLSAAEGQGGQRDVPHDRGGRPGDDFSISSANAKVTVSP